MRKRLAVSPARPQALPAGPIFYFRPEHHDHRFFEDYPRRGPFDAALISSRYLASHPAGSKRASQGLTGRELADALDLSGAPYVIDPDTPVLVEATGDLPTPRLVTMPHAQVLPLPLSRLSFANARDRVEFAQVAAGAQRGAAALVAPYFQFERTGDRWHDLNLTLIDDVRAFAQGRPLCAFVQAPLRSLRTGEVARAAVSYGDAGVERIFLRVAGFDPEEVDEIAVAAYRRALDAFGNVGVDAVADCVGRFGLVAVAAGTAGFSSGARFFQRVPAQRTYDPLDDMMGTPCLYEVPKRWRAMPPKEARRDATLPPCPVENCSALATGSQSRDQKEHLIHYFTVETRVAAQGGVAAARRSLQRHPSGNSNAWLVAV